MMLFLLWYLTIFHHLCQKKFPALLHSAYLIKLHDKQECIPIGCIPPASVATMSVLGGVSVPIHRDPLHRDLPFYRDPLHRDPLSQRPSFTEIPWTEIPLDRDTLGQRPPLDWEPPCPWTEPALDRVPWDPPEERPPTPWTETPFPPGQRPPYPPHQTPLPPPDKDPPVDRQNLRKHYLAPNFVCGR